MSLPLLVMVNTPWLFTHAPVADRLDLSQVLSVGVSVGVADGAVVGVGVSDGLGVSVAVGGFVVEVGVSDGAGDVLDGFGVLLGTAPQLSMVALATPVPGWPGRW